jgi:hypothetical protein
MHQTASVYHNLGGGGVDLAGVFQVLRDVLGVKLPPPG